MFQGVTIVLCVTWIFGPQLWREKLPFDILPARAFEWVLYISGVLSSHPFIIYNVYKFVDICFIYKIISFTHLIY